MRDAIFFDEEMPIFPRLRYFFGWFFLLCLHSNCQFGAKLFVPLCIYQHSIFTTLQTSHPIIQIYKFLKYFAVSHCCCSYKGKQQKGIKRKTADPVTRSSKDSKDYDAKDTKEHEKLITYLGKAGDQSVMSGLCGYRCIFVDESVFVLVHIC
ncbi:hypothetical protein Dimus_030482 [Dionaea muscipula]